MTCKPEDTTPDDTWIVVPLMMISALFGLLVSGSGSRTLASVPPAGVVLVGLLYWSQLSEMLKKMLSIILDTQNAEIVAEKRTFFRIFC